MPNYRRALVPGGCWFFTAICAIVQPTCWPAHIDGSLASKRRNKAIAPYGLISVRGQNPGPCFTRNTSLADAEIPENDIEHILDVNPPGKPAQVPRGEAEFLGDHVFAARLAFSQGTIQRFGT